MVEKLFLFLRRYARFIPFMYSTSSDVVKAIQKNIDQLDQIGKVNDEKIVALEKQVATLLEAQAVVAAEVERAAKIKANMEALIGK